MPEIRIRLYFAVVSMSPPVSREAEKKAGKAQKPRPKKYQAAFNSKLLKRLKKRMLKFMADVLRTRLILRVTSC